MNPSAPFMISDSETSILFNPAFCAFLLNRSCVAYGKKATLPMPVTFAFLILPSALHKPTRDALPETTAASMWGWLRENPILLMDFSKRVETFRPIAGSAIAFGLRHGALTSAPGEINAGKLNRRPRTLKPTEDWSACVKSAEFLGRWFGGSNIDEATTLAHWGVKP